MRKKKEYKNTECIVNNQIGEFMFCRKCGTQLEESVKFCYKCGTPINKDLQSFVAGNDNDYLESSTENNNVRKQENLKKTTQNKKKTVLKVVITLLVFVVVGAGVLSYQIFGKKEGSHLSDVIIIKWIIRQQNALGANVPTHLDDSDVYTWDENGRLSGINWNDRELKEELSFEGLTALTEINCGANDITSLDVSDCNALTYLYCTDNKITRLDISNCPYLTNEMIDCDSDVIVWRNDFVVNTSLVVEQGDIIRVSYQTKVEGAAQRDWEDEGEKEFVVDTSSDEFWQSEGIITDEDAQEYVDQVVGRKENETFELIFPGSDGDYYIRYTILEIIKS